MDILRRNTDYALRMMVHLANSTPDKPASTKQISNAQDIPYPLACKLMQKLSKANLVTSKMGAKGGFQLGKAPAKINLPNVIAAIQGPVKLNRCLIDAKSCKRQPQCTISAKLLKLQKTIDSFLKDVTLAELIQNQTK